MSSERQYAQFSDEEQREIECLERTMQNPGSSRLEQQIAKAKLDSLKHSKVLEVLIIISEPPPHNHKHRMRGAEEAGSDGSNIYHNDEAFERFAMGEDEHTLTGPRANQPAANRQSVKMSEYSPVNCNTNFDVIAASDHKARGTAKMKAEYNLPSEESELHSSFMG
ncbi:hypothetical protein CVT25_008977 [Psilocybe cyanescens]|uniref:Uncharacterized protein n=1 Tax=Psilocybe cyanescens TaxID=93625 RepID=A0A409XN37_PSICY|nr:hypothetical protein CVT25_008977 [Psilocybe cyanescens]